MLIYEVYIIIGMFEALRALSIFSDLLSPYRSPLNQLY